MWSKLCPKLSNWSLNTLRLRENVWHFADDIFKHISFNENVSILIKVPLKFVPKVATNNILALVQIMALHCPGDKPLSEQMLVILMMHICITRPKWVNCKIPAIHPINHRILETFLIKSMFVEFEQNVCFLIPYTCVSLVIFVCYIMMNHGSFIGPSQAICI